MRRYTPAKGDGGFAIAVSANLSNAAHNDSNDTSGNKEAGIEIDDAKNVKKVAQ